MRGLWRQFGEWLQAGEEPGPDQIVGLPLGSDVARSQLIIATCRSEGLVVELEPHLSHAYPFFSQEPRLLVRGADVPAVQAIITDLDTSS